MLDIYNVITATFLFFILFIISRNVLLSKGKEKHELREYKWFIMSICLFLIADAGWGIVHGLLHSTTIFFFEAIFYNVTMIFTVFTCCRYVSRFLELQNGKGKILTVFGDGFFFTDLVLVVVNFFYPVLFWVDGAGDYHTGIGREIGMFILVAVFVTMAIMALVASGEMKGFIKQKIIAIFYFATFITITLFIQAILPEFPCYSLGLVTGALMIYVQIHVADQSVQLGRITALNNYLEDSQIKLEKSATELQQQKHMLEASNIGTWELIYKSDFTIIMHSDNKMKELMGIFAGSTINDEEIVLYHRSRINSEDVALFMEYNSRLMSGVHSECTYRWNHPTLGERYVRCGGARTSSPNAEEIVMSGYHYDVTEMIKLEKELKISVATSEMKTKFLQNMSHEIRTPLNAMFGFSQLLGMPDGTWSEEEKTKFNSIIYNTYNMLDMLVYDILDSADVKSGNYQMHMSDFSVNEVGRNAMASVEFRRPGNVEMNFSSDLDDGHAITSDPRRIQQILINFLTNACKNTARGEIHMHITDKEIPGKIIFSVTDTGKGVPPENAEIIFGRYTKLDRKAQGTGLGLNICHTIATQLNARVYLDTSYTGGARFKLEVEDKLTKNE